jgi:pimeloyl-ACP methyl ester carboxylesterase
LCLHGFPDSAHTWRHLLPELAAAGFRAVAPWTRGYAPTTIPPDGDFSVNALVTDTNALHDALGGDSDAVLIGHDWGAITTYGATGLGTLPDGTAKWRRAVAIAVPPPPIAPEAFFRYAQLKKSFYIFVFQTPLAELVVGADDMVFLDRLWNDWSPAYNGEVDLAKVKESLRAPDNLAAAIGYYRAMFAGGTLDAVGPQPILYLHGTNDGAFGVEGVRGTEEHLSAESKVEILDGVGHFLHLEDPAGVNRKILDWVTA